MAEKLSDKLKGLFKRADTYLGKAIERKPKITKAMGPSQTQYKMFKAGQKTKNLMKGLSLTKKLDKPASASKALITASAAKKARNIGKLKTISRIASRAALPVAAGVETVSLAYKLATRTPEQKAKTKALKTELSKKSTKQSHADLMKMSTGGDTMLKDPKKADLDKDGKLSGYEKKRGKAIESNMMKAFKGSMADSKKSSQERSKLMVQLKKKISGAAISESEAEKLMNMSTPEIKSKIKNMYKGGESKGYGAARTSGMGLQDEELIPGKSLDYYKDIM